MWGLLRLELPQLSLKIVANPPRLQGQQKRIAIAKIPVV